MEWKEDIAADFCSSVTDGTHDSPKATINGKKLITSKHLKDGYIDFESAKFISEKDYLKVIERSKVDQFDILFSMIGTIGNIYRETSPNIEYAVKNMGIFKMGGNAIRSKWLYYWLKSKEAHAYIYERMAGSTQSYLTLDSLRKFPVVYPEDINDMENIVSILSSLDRKIELNNKINADLEEMAQAIFKNWFVDFEPFKDGKFVDSELGMIPEGWKVGTLDEIFSLKYGKNLSTSMILEKGDYPVYGANGIIGYHNEYNCDKYSVLVTSRGNGSGDVSRTHHPKSFITNNSFVVEPLEQYKYIELPFINGLFNIIDFKSYCSGSAQPQLTNKAMRNICIISPPMEIVIKYCEMLETLFSHIECVIAENSRLSLLRDTLLPRLMSGEIEVPE